MRAALKTLPWVEPSSIVTDVPHRKVTFNVKDKSQFDLAQVSEALKKKNFDECELVAGPETPTAKP